MLLRTELELSTDILFVILCGQRGSNGNISRCYKKKLQRPDILKHSHGSEYNGS